MAFQHSFMRVILIPRASATDVDAISLYRSVTPVQGEADIHRKHTTDHRQRRVCRLSEGHVARRGARCLLLCACVNQHPSFPSAAHPRIVRVVRGDDGLGFSLQDTTPVSVCDVDPFAQLLLHHNCVTFMTEAARQTWLACGLGTSCWK